MTQHHHVWIWQPCDQNGNNPIWLCKECHVTRPRHGIPERPPPVTDEPVPKTIESLDELAFALATEIAELRNRYGDRRASPDDVLNEYARNGYVRS